MSRPLVDSLHYAPIGMGREEAARHIGLGTTLFDEMVNDGRMPRPRVVGNRRIWHRLEIELAFADLPVAGPRSLWDGNQGADGSRTQKGAAGGQPPLPNRRPRS